MHRKELFYYVTSGSNMMRNVHWCVTVFYQLIENGNIVNQIHGFTIDYSEFILINNKLITNRECSSCTGEYWPWSFIARTFLRSVSTATTSGQYSPVRPSCSVRKSLILCQGIEYRFYTSEHHSILTILNFK